MDRPVIHTLKHSLVLLELRQRAIQVLTFKLTLNHRSIQRHHAIRCPLILLMEVITPELAKRHVAQPAFDIIKQGRLLHCFLHQFAMLRPQCVHKPVLLRLVPHHAQLDLQQAKLERLKSRGREQVIPEIQKRLRRHCLQHSNLIHKNLEYLQHAQQPMQRNAHLPRAQCQIRKDAPNTIHLKNDLLEPYFVRLMNGDKQHLVMLRISCGERNGMLCVEDLIQTQIIRVIQI
mmetsp:Transcript_21807/g.37564  ORF Transcript_21807/g.37564 Transcript_21807/m.37564 type:complete len:232 (-) Transcript_21807:63-758(-)